MKIRIIPQPPSSDEAVAKLAGQRFGVTKTVDKLERFGVTLTSQTLLLDDELAALDAIRNATGCRDVSIMFESHPRPPGQYPLDRLTVVLSDDGAILRGFFG